MNHQTILGKKNFCLMPGLLLALASCHPSYELAKVEGGRIEMTSAYDRSADPQALAILQPYKKQVDSIMSPVIGRSAMSMKADRPESLLSNLVADMLRETSASFTPSGKKADVAVMNIGGLRSNLPEGNISYGNIYEILPFQNSFCLLTLKGKALKQLFSEIAQARGEGISGAHLEITRSGHLLHAEINGKPIDENRDYTVATIDYLAEGNDGMTAFRQGKNHIFPKEATIRQLFLNYVTRRTRQGKAITSRLDGRITFKP